MRKTKYKYILFDISNQRLPAYVGTAKEVAKMLYIDSSCVHKAAKNRKILMDRYLVLREEVA